MFIKSPFIMAMMYLKPMGFFKQHKISWHFMATYNTNLWLIQKHISSQISWQVFQVLNIVKNHFIYLDNYCNPTVGMYCWRNGNLKDTAFVCIWAEKQYVAKETHGHQDTVQSSNSWPWQPTPTLQKRNRHGLQCDHVFISSLFLCQRPLWWIHGLI